MEVDEKIDIYNSKIIKKFLAELFKDELSVKIWQNINETKNYSTGKIIKYKHHENLITFCPDPGEVFNFDPKKELYFHTRFKETIFKSEIVKASSDSVVIKRPALVKIKEARSEKRKNFGLHSYHFAELEFPNKEISKAQCLDTSKSGMGIMVGRPVFAEMSKGLKLKVVNSSVAEHIGKTAIVRNLSPIDNILTNEVSFRVGLEFVQD